MNVYTIFLYFHNFRFYISRDQLTRDEDDKILSDGDDENVRNTEGHMNNDDDVPMDEFEALIDEQIALSTVQNRTNFGDKSFGSISSINSSTQPNEQISVSTFEPPLSSSHRQPSSQAEPTELTSEMRARIAENRLKALEILEKRKAEAEEKRQQEELKTKQKEREISNINFDDDDF